MEKSIGKTKSPVPRVIQTQIKTAFLSEPSLIGRNSLLRKEIFFLFLYSYSIDAVGLVRFIFTISDY